MPSGRPRRQQIPVRSLCGFPRGACERTLRAAGRRFFLHGFNATGIDRIITEAGVAKMSLHQHFDSKDELVAAFLGRRNDFWCDPCGFSTRIAKVFEKGKIPFGTPKFESTPMEKS
jgi:AcrR family transcriptional regulator